MPEQDQTTVTIRDKPKSVIAAFLLAFLFGPLGLLYASIGGGITMIIISVIIVPATGGIALLLTWPISIVWALIAASGTTERTGTVTTTSTSAKDDAPDAGTLDE